MCGIIKSAVDIATSPFDSVSKLAKGDLGGAFLAPLSATFEADLFFGADFGDIMSMVDDVLDEVPYLKEAIVVAAGVATGGVGAIVAAAAIAAADTLSEVNEGTFELSDLASGGVEFASLAATGATAGAAGALTTTAKTQIATRVLASSGLLGEDASRYVQIAGGAVGGDWSSVSESIRNGAVALQQTGLLGDDVNNVLGAVAAASAGDYSSLQTGVTAGIEAAQNVSGEDVDPYLAGLSTAINGDYRSARTITDTAIHVADDTNLLGQEEQLLQAGHTALHGDWTTPADTLLQAVDDTDILGSGEVYSRSLQAGVSGDLDSPDGVVDTVADVVGETGILGADGETILDLSEDAIQNENYRDLVGL